jgi:hypothetical protein
MSHFRSLSYKSYLSDANLNVPRETKRRRQKIDESFNLQVTNQQLSFDADDSEGQSVFDTYSATYEESQSNDWVS